MKTITKFIPNSCLTAALLVLTTPMFCAGWQDDQVRKDNNKKLDFMVGQWSTVHQAGDRTFQGKATIKWSVGGSWLIHEFYGKRSDRDEYYMTHLMNYSVGKKKYNCLMVDKFGGEPGIFYGDWVDDNTLVVKASFEEEDGTVSHQKFTIVRVSEKEFKFHRGFSDDGENYHFELTGTYTRKQ